jgi:D-methionine transport system substrate-binding protein
MKSKKLVALGLTLALSIAAAACGSKTPTTTTAPTAAPTTAPTKAELKTLKVGATPVPHAEILEVIKPLLEAKGYKLEIIEFTDYVTPNKALSSKELDANFFQHVPYLEEMNTKENLKLTYTVKVHVEPIAFYSETLKDIKDLPDGATIAIPNDPTNGARALILLANNGLIKVKDGLLITAMDITENPKKLKFEELEAAAIARALQDVDGAVINTNYALEAGLNPVADALIIEDQNSPYANILAVREDNKDDAGIKALGEALNSPEVKKFIADEYKGAIVPAF